MKMPGSIQQHIHTKCISVWKSCLHKMGEDRKEKKKRSIKLISSSNIYIRIEKIGKCKYTKMSSDSFPFIRKKQIFFFHKD